MKLTGRFKRKKKKALVHNEPNCGITLSQDMMATDLYDFKRELNKFIEGISLARAIGLEISMLHMGMGQHVPLVVGAQGRKSLCPNLLLARTTGLSGWLL